MRSNSNALESNELGAFLNQGKSIGTLNEEAFISSTHSLGQRGGVRLTGNPDSSNENNLPVSDLIFQAQSGICHLMGDPGSTSEGFNISLSKALQTKLPKGSEKAPAGFS